MPRLAVLTEGRSARQRAPSADSTKSAARRSRSRVRIPERVRLPISSSPSMMNLTLTRQAAAGAHERLGDLIGISIGPLLSLQPRP